MGLDFGIFRRLGRYLHNLVLIKTHLAVEKGLKVDFFGFWTGFSSQFQAEKAFWKGFKRGSKVHFFLVNRSNTKAPAMKRSIF